MAAILLCYSDAAGSQFSTQLSIQGDSSTFFLPDEPPCGDSISLSPCADSQHSYLCLEVHHSFALLRTFDNTHGAISVNGVDHSNVELPVSTADHQKSFVLRCDDDFLAPSGRWRVKWVGDGTISNSMRPPVLELVTGAGDTESGAETLEELIDDTEVSPDHQEAAVRPRSSGQSSEETCSPTPSPAKARDDSSTKDEEGHQDSNTLASSGIPSKTSDGGKSGLCERMNAVEDVRQAENDNPIVTVKPNHMPAAAGPGNLSAPAPASEVPVVSPPEEAHETYSDTSSMLGSNTGQSPGELSVDLNDLHGSVDPMLEATAERGVKRKMKEVEVVNPSPKSMNVESETPHDAERSDTIVVGQKAKQPYVLIERSFAGETPARPDKVRRTSTPNSPPSESEKSSEQTSTKRNKGRQRESSSTGRYVGSPPVIVFSGNTTMQENRAVVSRVERLGGKFTIAINDANILCIPEGSVRKTGKLLIAVAKGVDIVTERWIADSCRLGGFLAPDRYLPRDSVQERAWRCTLSDAVARGKEGLGHLLNGTTVYFTKQLRDGLGNLERDMSRIAWILGAQSVKRRLPALKDKDNLSTETVLIVGVHGDSQGLHVARLGQPLFNKDILTMAVLRGEVERTSQEFAIEAPIKEEDNT